MTKSETIKTTIDANINTNGNQAITGAVMNSVLKQMVDSTDAQLTELSGETIKANDTEIPLGDAYQVVPTSLKKGMIIESIGTTSMLILIKEDGTEHRITTSDLPYTLPFNVVAIASISNASGSNVVVKNLLDSKLHTLSIDLQNEITTLDERVSMDIAEVESKISEDIAEVSAETVKIYDTEIPLGDAYQEISVSLKAGMMVESIGSTPLLILRKEDGTENRITSSNLPYTLPYDVVVIVPTANANGSKMVVKNLLDSKLHTLSVDLQNEITTLDERVSMDIAEVKSDIEWAMGSSSYNVPSNIELIINRHFSQGDIVRFAASANNISGVTLGGYIENGGAEDIVRGLGSGEIINITFQKNYTKLYLFSSFDAVASLYYDNSVKGQLESVKKELHDKDMELDAEIQNVKQNAATFNDTKIPLGDAYQEMSVSLKKGMIIESIGTTSMLILRKEDGTEHRITTSDLPYTLPFNVVVVVPISNASGSNVVVQSILSAEFESIKSRLGTWKTDLSKESEIIIPLPTSLVAVNISASEFPTSKFDDILGFIEFYDRDGNYFRKPIEGLALQGSTSILAPKKNLKFDFSDCTLKVGNWVVQDGFHLKANYFDVFRGKSNLAYDFWRKIIEFNRPQTFRTPYINSDEYSWYDGKDNMSNDFNEARLTPAGFPIELYFNGEYQGIYTWNIKKDRANYAMDKKNADNIHIDPSHIRMLLTGELLDWAEFEIRNPKSLITMNGAAYDGDSPSELIDSSSAAYDGNNADHKRSASVKASIIAFKDACAEVVAKSDKTTFEKYFDKDWFVDFHIWGNVILDGDSLARNTQYLYWGDKWYPTPYDCDQIYGNNWRGNFIYRKKARVVNKTILGKGRDYGIYDIFLTLYEEDIKKRYKELRDADVISPDAIITQISQYVDLIGKDAYAKEFELWSETPSYREPNDNPQWKYEGDYYEREPSEWNNQSTYNVGDYVYVVIEGDSYYWKCLEENIGIRPYTDEYTNTPIVGGYFDSLIRTEKWLDIRFNFLDEYYNYL